MKIYCCSIPSDTGCLCSAVKEVMNHLTNEYGVLEESIEFELTVILNELIINAMKHGNKGEIEKKVKIIAGTAKGEYAFFIIEDEGEGCSSDFVLNCKNNIEEIIDVCDLKETGRGILIVNNLCDKVKFNRKGNKIIVLKRLTKVESN